MTKGVGFRIYTNIKRPSQELVERFRGLPSSNIADNMGRLYCIGHQIRPLNEAPLLGVAFTVKAPQGDNLMFHRALDLAKPGDIIVVDGEGDLEHSLAGELMVRYAIKRGLGGFIVDGCMRDSDALAGLDFPIYARGITPQGPYKNGPGEINVPICCGGQVVMPGDILVGDRDGVVVIRPEDAEELAEVARRKFEKEQEQIKENTFNKKWVADLLIKQNVVVYE
ncbi:RraA family protein [Desulfitobacterium hafniense]|uniref:RraA family protein n=1 Tax=Desulfitobacterium hafniense TaxID=49338 RepID=UPI000380401D|nr:RraA family protein [Desulfitobacterium hafniense]